MSLVRSVAVFKLGVWAGMLGAAAFFKRAVPSRGDAESDEISLVAVMDGIGLKSRATAFRGGSLLAWFGGMDVDFREAELAPGARLTVNVLFGGITLMVPPEWRIESQVRAVGGGFDVPRPAADSPDAPVLVVDGRVLLGGVSVRSGRGEDRDAAGDDRSAA